jgi:hypothetical protein
MDNIIEPNESFDFSSISLGHPVSIQGGAYFTKLESNSKPLYIQTPKSLSKQGIVKSGKKFYCDLMFTNENAQLINWFEKFEEKCQDLLFQKKEEWFQDSLDKNDIENAFNSLIRIYKSGKYYLIRSNIKQSNQTSLPIINIYDENERQVSIEDIKPETEMISIIELQGIKFTSRNFQIEITLRQIMVLDGEPLFDNCLIKTSKHKSINPLGNKLRTVTDLDNPLNTFEQQSIKKNLIDENANLKEENIETTDIKTEEKHMDSILEEKLNILEDSDKLDEKDKFDEIDEKKEMDTIEENDELKNENPNDNINLEIQDLDLNEDFNEKNEIVEINDIDNSLDESEPLTLRKPNQIYIDLYKKAREKAKQAKKEVILAYLEAKNIKNTYLIDDLPEDELSVLDEEIDEVSESELQSF